MKKIIALSLILIMILSFTGCSSKKLSTKNLAGTWDADLSIKEYSAMSGNEIGGDDDDLPAQYIERINDLKLPMRIVFNEDGTCNTKIKKSALDDLFSDMTDIVMDFYKDQGLLMLYQANGVQVQTNEELETYFVNNKTTTKEVLEALEVTIKATFESAKEDMDFGKVGSDGYYTTNKKPEKYTVNEDNITITTEKSKDEIMYCELTDENTLKINKLYFDYEEYEFEVLFKRQ